MTVLYRNLCHNEVCYNEEDLSVPQVASRLLNFLFYHGIITFQNHDLPYDIKLYISVVEFLLGIIIVQCYHIVKVR